PPHSNLFPYTTLFRSANNKGFYTWLAKQDADVVCMQEIKAQAADMTREMLQPEGFYGYFHYAEKKGYSGVGIYSKKQPDAIIERSEEHTSELQSRENL